MSMSLQFTVGMALIDSPPFSESIRAMFTVMSLQLHHPQVTEIIIVDNRPHPNNPLQNLPSKTRGLVKYIPMPDPVGTSAPRNRVFAEAQNEFVACMDPHVLLYPNSFDHIVKFYEKYGEECPDIIHGSMMTETRNNVMATHMNDQWRSEMWGTWGWAWEKDGVRFSVVDRGNNQLEYVTLRDEGEQRPMSQGELRKLTLPENLGWSQHEIALTQAGCGHPLEPFAIPGHGMGFWACRKDAWLPFHPLCRGFGGEEMTTGVRFRKAGRRVWCIPRVRWWHHFDRMHGGTVPYLLSAWDKCRNYILEFTRMGMDVTPIHEHFVLGKNGADRPVVPQAEWQQMLNGVEWPGRDPVITDGFLSSRQEALNVQLAKNEPTRRHQGDQPVLTPKKPETLCGKNDPAASILASYNAVIGQQSPINQDLPHLKHLAATCSVAGKPGDVVEISHQNLSAIAILAAVPKSLAVYGYADNPTRAQHVRKITDALGTAYSHNPSLPNGDGIPACDLLFLDIDPHTESVYYDLLKVCAPQVRRYIVLHDSIVYGETYNNEPGLMPAVRRFLTDSDRTWFVAKNYATQNGLLVLSRFEEDSLLPDAPEAELALSQAAKPVVTQQVPDFGPGTELRDIFKSIGVVEKPDCDCSGKMSQMNVWGVAGCRQNTNTIIGWMRDGMERWGWIEQMKAAARAVLSGLAFKINPADPWPGIINLAIDRAEQKEKVPVAS